MSNIWFFFLKNYKYKIKNHQVYEYMSSLIFFMNLLRSTKTFFKKNVHQLFASVYANLFYARSEKSKSKFVLVNEVDSVLFHHGPMFDIAF